VIQEVVQMTSVLVHVNHTPFPPHASETVGHVLVELHLAEEPVEEPAEEESRLVIQPVGMKVLLGPDDQGYETSAFFCCFQTKRGKDDYIRVTERCNQIKPAK